MSPRLPTGCLRRARAANAAAPRFLGGVRDASNLPTADPRLEGRPPISPSLSFPNRSDRVVPRTRVLVRRRTKRASPAVPDDPDGTPEGPETQPSGGLREIPRPRKIPPRATFWTGYRTLGRRSKRRASVAQVDRRPGSPWISHGGSHGRCRTELRRGRKRARVSGASSRRKKRFRTFRGNRPRGLLVPARAVPETIPKQETLPNRATLLGLSTSALSSFDSVLASSRRTDGTESATARQRDSATARQRDSASMARHREARRGF